VDQRPGALAGKQVLDVGCGGGILADAMARKGAEVLGIDLATKALKVAQLHALEAKHPRVQYREISAEALAAQAPGQFDVVTCMEMLEHVPDPARSCGPAPRWSSRAAGCFFHHQPQPQVIPVCHRGRGIRAQHAAARHARIRQADPPQRTRGYCRAAGLDLQATVAWNTTR
jgi:2-polyprenyl-6-hydroxyphenyl methylase/3-demethylubiquinone-9 3-methyltransferase